MERHRCGALWGTEYIAQAYRNEVYFPLHWLVIGWDRQLQPLYGNQKITRSGQMAQLLILLALEKNSGLIASIYIVEVSQTTITPVSKDQIPSSVLCRHQAQSAQTYM